MINLTSEVLHYLSIRDVGTHEVDEGWLVAVPLSLHVIIMLISRSISDITGQTHHQSHVVNTSGNTHANRGVSYFTG